MMINRIVWILAGAALTVPGGALAQSAALTAALSGANATGGGDTDGSGRLVAKVDAEAGDFCYTLSAKGLDNVTMAHVHEGAAGSDGKPVIKLDVTGDDSDECVAADPDTLKAIIAAPQNYYVNIHTTAFPGGAVRGQLVKGG